MRVTRGASHDLGDASEGPAGCWARNPSFENVCSPPAQTGGEGRVQGWGDDGGAPPPPAQPTAHMVPSQSEQRISPCLCDRSGEKAPCSTQRLGKHLVLSRDLPERRENLPLVPTKCSGPRQPISLTTPTYPSRFSSLPGRQHGFPTARFVFGREETQRRGGHR
jgi:hypothetical protein